MEVASELSQIKDKAKQSVVAAVNDTVRLTALVKLLEDIERDTATLGQLERNVSEYHARLAGATNGSSGATQTILRSTGSKKQLGNSVREAFAQAHGLRQVKGVVYANPSGSTAAIAMATEDKRGDKWWLGLPDDQFNCAVLLCQDGNTWKEFVLPAQALAGVWSRLSRSTSGIKFNVKRAGLNYILLVPRYGPFDITRFMGDYSPL